MPYDAHKLMMCKFLEGISCCHNVRLQIYSHGIECFQVCVLDFAIGITLIEFLFKHMLFGNFKVNLSRK